MVNIIKYEDKSPYQTLPEIPNENKTTAENMNEIKTVVNGNAKELDNTKDNVEELIKKMNVIVAPALVYKGSVHTYSELEAIENAKNGDIYSVTNENKNYVYSDNDWIEYTPIIDFTEINTQIQNIIDTLPSKIDNAILEDNKKKYPVGKIIMSTEGINPATYLEFGDWELWGSGRVPVGVNISDEEFNSAEKIGGEKTHKLTIKEIPSHNHGIYFADNNGGAGQKDTFTYNGYVRSRELSTAIANTGGGQAHNNMPPYITCYMWKRIS